MINLGREWPILKTCHSHSYGIRARTRQVWLGTPIEPIRLFDPPPPPRMAGRRGALHGRTLQMACHLRSLARRSGTGKRTATCGELLSASWSRRIVLEAAEEAMSDDKNFDRSTLEYALAELGQRAFAADRTVEIVIYRGSALLLTLNWQINTGDVDAVFEGNRDFIKKLAAEMAEEFGWDENWLNDGVKDWLSKRDADPDVKALSAVSKQARTSTTSSCSRARSASRIVGMR